MEYNLEHQSFDIHTIEKSNKDNCIICKNKISSVDIIYQDQDFIAFLDLYPPTKGYAIVAPKAHFEDITEISIEEHLRFETLVYYIAMAIHKTYTPPRICQLNTGGILKHYHFHIIPMYDDVDKNIVRVIEKKEILTLTKDERIEMVHKIQDSLQQIMNNL